MASGPITSWQLEGKNVEAVIDLLLVSKITADGDCSHEIRRWLLLGKKAMKNLVSVLKSRDITLLTKVHIVKAMVFPVVTYGCESWTINKFCRTWKNGCLRTVVLEKTPESPLDSKEIKPVYLKGDQPWIFTGRTDAEAQYFGHLIQLPTHWKSPWCWERLRAEGEDGIRGWDGWMASLMQWTWTWVNLGMLAGCSPWGCKELEPTG